MARLIPDKWLGPPFFDAVREDPSLLDGYGPGYSSEMTGEGNWSVLYEDQQGDYPIGLLWCNPDADSVDIERVDGFDIDKYMIAKLKLHKMFQDGVPALMAYQQLLEQYEFTSDEQTGDLADAGRYVVH